MRLSPDQSEKLSSGRFSTSIAWNTPRTPQGALSILTKFNKERSLEIKEKFLDKILTITSQLSEEMFYPGNLSDLCLHLRQKDYSCFGDLDKALIRRSFEFLEMVFWERVKNSLRRQEERVNLDLLNSQKIILFKKKLFLRKNQNIFLNSQFFQNWLYKCEDSRYCFSKRYQMDNILKMFLLENSQNYIWYFSQLFKYLKSKIKQTAKKKSYYSMGTLCTYIEIGLRFKTWSSLMFSNMIVNEVFMKDLKMKNGSSKIQKFLKDAPEEQLERELCFIHFYL